MIGKKINQLATELAPVSTDLTIIGDPTTGVSKKITLAQLGAIFSGAVSFYTNLAAFPNPGTIDVIYCAKDTQKLYLWSGSAYVEVFPSQALLNTYQLRSEKGNANGYASLDSLGKVPISQLPSSIMEYKGTWNASTNTPTLANGTGDTGDVYICNVAGTVNFGAGPLTFAVGDYVIYSGTIWQRSSGAVGTVTSVAASITGNSVSISGSPIVTSGTLAFAFAGNATQYVRGDGQLATLPTNGGGGGASVSYYLNGSINQGTIGGVTYYEMNKTPIIGAGTDFTRNSNGYIASFLTDANDPALLNIPAGNFNFETYFSATSGGGSPTFYIELYKYDGTTFTLIASNSTSPKLINDGTNIEAYFSALAVPQTTLTLTDRLAIQIYVTTAGRTITLHTENSHLCQVITTFTTGLTALNGLTAQVQYLATGTSGTDFNISSATATHTFNLPTASATNRGALSSADWSTFNAKQNALTLTTTGSSGAATLVGATLNIPNYGSALTGYVPYTGATTNVNLGTNNITSQNLISDGNGSTTGGYLAFKQYNASNSGLQGHTSIYALGQTSLYLRYSQTDLSQRGVDLSAALLGTTTRQYLFPDKNGTFAMLSDIPALTGYVTGSGINNYIAKFTSTGSVIGNSQIIDNGTSVLIGASGSIPNVKVVINSTTQRALEVVSTNTNALFVQSPAASIMTISNGTWSTNFTNTGRLDLAGDLLINTIANATTDTDKFLVSDGGVVKYRTATEFISDIGGPYVSSVAALTIGTTGTDLSSTVANSTTTPVITLNVPTASATNRGALSSADWTTFNNKQNTLTNPVTGTGTINTIPKFTGASTIGNSQLFDNGTNVGIGTALPTVKLQVIAALNSDVAIFSGANLTRGLKISTAAGTDNDDIAILNAQASTGTLAFQTASATKMTLSNSGNLGLGVTPTNGTGDVKHIEISSGGRFVAAGNNGEVGTNYYYDSAYKYITTNAVTRLEMNGGAFKFYNAISGSANAAITFTQAMTLDASGRLGIGVTSPTAILDINAGANPPIIRLTSSAVGQIPFSIRANIPGFSNAGFSIYDETAAANRLVISSTGNVGIGTTGASNVRLYIKGNNTANTDFSIYSTDTNDNVLIASRNDGVIYTGTRSFSPYNLTTSSAANMHVASDGALYRSTSSLKYKNNVRDYDKGLDIINQMRPVYYNGKNDGNTLFAGLIAEEIHDLGLTEFVQYAKDGTPDALAYSNMIALLVQGMKELKQELDTLKNK